MAEIYDESNYRAQAPEPTYSGAGRRIRPENLLSPQGSVFGFEEARGPLGVNLAANTLKDTTRGAAGLASKVPVIRKAAVPVHNFLTSGPMVALDKAQSAVGPAVEFLTDANSSKDPYHNKYRDLAVNSAGAVAEYNRFIPSPGLPFAWALGGSAEALQNQSSAEKNIALARMYDPKARGDDEQLNADVVAQLLQAANANWGKGSAYGMLPFNPYDRLASAMDSETRRISQIIAAGVRDGDENAYYERVGSELNGLTELIRLAAEEEGDRASPASVFGGGTFALKQAIATLTDGKAMSREEKDAETIALLRAASVDRAETKKRRDEDARKMREAVFHGYHLDPRHAPTLRDDVIMDRKDVNMYAF